MSSESFRARYAHLAGPVAAELPDGGRPSTPGPPAAWAGPGRPEGGVRRKMTGEQLLAFAGEADRWWLGRQGGLHGELAREDIATGGWRRHPYPVASGQRPGPQYFSLAELLAAVETGGRVEVEPRGRPTRMTGDQLKTVAFEEGTEGVWVGRLGGLHGQLAQEDIATGRWRTWTYRVEFGERPPRGGNWFGLTDLLAEVAAARARARAAVGWEEVGVVVVDTSAVAFALPGVPLPVPGGLQGPVVGFVIGADNDYPVEVRHHDGQVVEVRIDAVDDVDELEGSWEPVGVLDVGPEGIVAIDPGLSDGAVPVSVPAGRWTGGVFVSGGDRLALRLVPETQSRPSSQRR